MSAALRRVQDGNGWLWSRCTATPAFWVATTAGFGRLLAQLALLALLAQLALPQ